MAEVPQASFEGLAADIVAGVPGLRDALRARLAAARDAGEAARLATLLLLHVLAEFADFRGLAEARAAFDPTPPDAADQRRADAVRLGLPSLDHALDPDDPTLASVRSRLFAALRDGSGLAAVERVLLAKVWVDHQAMRNDFAGCERVLALLQDTVPATAPHWQAAWWRLAAEIHGIAGHPVLAQAALARVNALLPQLGPGEAMLAQACEDMRLALDANDLARADRVYRVIDQQRPHVRPATLPHGLRAQAQLLLRRGEFEAALAHTALMLALCEDHEVPERDRAGYVEQRAHALAGLGRHAEAVAVLEALRPSQVGGQRQVLEAIIAMARAVQALAEDDPQAHARALEAVRCAKAVPFPRFLGSAPHWAARIAAIGLAAGVETEFLLRAVRERRLPPPQPARADWPWALHVEAFGTLRVRRDGAALGGQGGKAQKKPLELLMLLAARPAGIDAGELLDRLWPSLDAEAPKASLEMAIARLRKWLALPEAVRVADGRVALNAELAWTDVAAFEAACDAGDADAALAHYRAPLLAGELLVARERAHLAARLVAVVFEALPGRAPAAARALLTRALAAEPQASVLARALAEL